MSRPIRTLLFSTLYPSSVRPAHGIFVETRLRELLRTGQIETRVVAPVPWFPSTRAWFGEYALHAATPTRETRHAIDVRHPRYFLLPKIGMNLAPRALAAAAIPVVRGMIEDGFDFDLIDAHYYYPDGVAAGYLAEAVNKPFIVTARGTDINLIPQYRRPREMILETARSARASIGVCRALADSLAELGVPRDKLRVFRNGVDLERFSPMPRDEARREAGLGDEKRRILISVGHLIPRKGHDIAIRALPLLPSDVILLIVGSGPERAGLQTLASSLNVSDRVQFVGQVANVKLKAWYSAADALVLCSSREGWANVLLEAMACGTPVVATNIWGTPEVVSNAMAGRLMAERTPDALRNAVLELFQDYPERSEVRRHAEGFSWQETTEAQLALFREIACA